MEKMLGRGSSSSSAESGLTAMDVLLKGGRSTSFGPRPLSVTFSSTNTVNFDFFGTGMLLGGSASVTRALSRESSDQRLSASVVRGCGAELVDLLNEEAKKGLCSGCWLVVLVGEEVGSSHSLGRFGGLGALIPGVLNTDSGAAMLLEALDTRETGALAHSRVEFSRSKRC